MIRYFYSTSLFVCCLTLPLKAKDKETCTNNHVKDRNIKASLSTKNQASTSSSVARSSTSTDEDAEKTRTIHAQPHAEPSERLARLTAYWSGEGDYYTGHGLSSTGVHLHDGHCAVDPRIIPYGSEVNIEGLGTYLAVDTGSAVISREAARETGHTEAQRNALVIDLYFESRRAGEEFAASGPKFASITWHSPDSTENVLKKHHSLADDNN
jgi:3D (Asp-Asp-Asp) domain-containing protein